MRNLDLLFYVGNWKTYLFISHNAVTKLKIKTSQQAWANERLRHALDNINRRPPMLRYSGQIMNRVKLINTSVQMCNIHGYSGLLNGSMTYYRSLWYKTKNHYCKPVYCVQWCDTHSLKSNALFIILLKKLIQSSHPADNYLINVFGSVFPRGVGFSKIVLD